MLTVEQAAERLGVAPEQVRRLARSGMLPAGKVGRTVVFDDDVVERRARLAPRAGRVLAPRTAWAALWALSGDDATWLPASDRSRLQARVRAWDAKRLLAGVRVRADRYDLRVLPAYRDRVLARNGVVASGITAADTAGADIVAGSAIDEVYCSVAVLAKLRRDFGVSERGLPNLVVRVPRLDAVPLANRSQMPTAVVAVDLAESVDTRTRRAGLTLLAAILRAAY